MLFHAHDVTFAAMAGRYGVCRKASGGSVTESVVFAVGAMEGAFVEDEAIFDDWRRDAPGPLLQSPFARV